MEPIKPINLREAFDRNVTENPHLNPNLREGINRVSGNENNTINIQITGPDGSEISSENLQIYVEQKEIIEILRTGAEVNVKPIKPVNRGGGPPRPHFFLDFSRLLVKAVVEEINTKEVGLESEIKLVCTIPLKEAM